MIDYQKIRVLFMDVDGTLTDGKIYMSDKGELFKAFDVKDGCGIKDILPSLGIEPVIITARESEILSRRAQELNISMCFQNIRDKEEKIHEIMRGFGYSPNKNGYYEEAAYIGDDILDIKPMALCALKACPADAVREVTTVCDVILNANGGNGAVREFISLLSREVEK